MKILKDNTHETYFTRCKWCCSEIEYEYNDVYFSEVPYSYIPKREITCPCCNNTTGVELKTKDTYSDSTQSYLNLPLTCGVPSI